MKNYPKAGLIGRILHLIRHIQSLDVPLYAANAGFFMILSLFPALVLILSLLRFTGLQVASLVEVLSNLIPEALMPTVAELVLSTYENSSAGLVGVSALTAIWSASKGIYGLLTGLNTVYGVAEDRGWFYTRFISVLYTFLFFGLVILTLIVHVFGGTILELLPTYRRVKLEHKSSYTYPSQFLAEGETAKGHPAQTVTIKFSKYKTGSFSYDAATGLYNISQHGAPYVDGNTGEQVAVKNVLVLFTDVDSIKGDDKGRQTIKVTGTGNGQFFCDGTAQAIIWSKDSNDSPLVYTTADGQPLKLGVGHTYVNIVDNSVPVTVE